MEIHPRHLYQVGTALGCNSDACILADSAWHIYNQGASGTFHTSEKTSFYTCTIGPKMSPDHQALRAAIVVLRHVYYRSDVVTDVAGANLRRTKGATASV